MNHSNNINNDNYNNIQYQIKQKKSYSPYYADSTTGSLILTDFDHFPYTRWGRGKVKSDVPIIAEREAGWRPRHDDCYKNIKDTREVKIKDICFQPACSTVYPCHLSSNYKPPPELLQNDMCIIEYR